MPIVLINKTKKATKSERTIPPSLQGEARGFVEYLLVNGISADVIVGGDAYSVTPNGVFPLGVSIQLYREVLKTGLILSPHGPSYWATGNKSLVSLFIAWRKARQANKKFKRNKRYRKRK